MSLIVFVMFGACAGAGIWWAIRFLSKPDENYPQNQHSQAVTTAPISGNPPAQQQSTAIPPLVLPGDVHPPPHHGTIPHQEQIPTHPAPEIAARFIQATSPGVIVLNVSKNGEIVRDPTCNLSMWNLSRNPPLSLPSFNQTNPGQFIKPSSSLLLATLDNPSMKPQIANGDRVFGLVTVDCPDCKAARLYWLYVVYGLPAEAWYSEIPEGQSTDLLAINKELQNSNWDVDVFMSRVPHGQRLIPKLQPES
jgi:hypothetical protein